MHRLRRPSAIGGTPALASLSQSQARLMDDGRRFENTRDRTSSASSSSASEVLSCLSVTSTDPPKRQANPAAHLLAGAIGGGISRTATAPIQTVRLRLVSGVMDGVAKAKGGLFGECARLARNEGWRALFKGNLTNVVRFAPTKGLDFFTFSVYKDFIGKQCGIGDSEDDKTNDDGNTSKNKKRKSMRAFQSMAAGAGAGLTSTALLFPLDNLTTRLAVSSSAAGVGVLGAAALRGGVGGLVLAFRAVLQTEGIRGLYRGIKPALLGIAPEAALTYGIFDLLKERCAQLERTKHAQSEGSGRKGKGNYDKRKERKVSAGSVIACAAVASLAGQTFAFPMESISRRLTAGATGSALQVAKSVIAERGAGGLYQGLGPATIRIVPMAAISFSVYEILVVVLDEAMEKAGF